MARNLNDVVCIYLKIRKGQPIIHMIDMWSRLTVSAILERKKPSCVIEEIMRKWTPHYGTTKTILNDNGGIFTSDEIREVKSFMNVTDLTTGAESPWQNGLCEKNHSLVDIVLDHPDEDQPHTPLD